MKKQSTAAQRRDLSARGWMWNKFAKMWERHRLPYDLTHMNPIQVSSALQALLVDSCCKIRWDAARQHAWPRPRNYPRP